jgi:hypothetical protein
MKKLIFQMKVLFIFLLLFSLSLNALSLNHFIGSWKNTNTRTRGITKVVISKPRGVLKVQVFGSCTPKDCDWGTEKAFAYSSSVSSSVSRNTQAITVNYSKGFSETFLILKLRNHRLSVESFTRFKDRSKRSNYRQIATFVPDKLGIPRQISPKNHAVFDHFPRKTTLRWSRVKGAVEYGVEIDCFHCCKSGKWCLDSDKKVWKTTKTKNRSYTFSYVGAQLGRWRVWAIDKNGKTSAKTPWRTFKYTR